jgi:hypothetical protein
MAVCFAVAPLQAGGCASEPGVSGMVPDHVTLKHRLSGDVAVSVAGNREGSAVGASEISNDTFARAISAAITKSGLFSRVEPPGARARFRLVAFIGKADQELQGPAQTVKLKVSYQLLDSPTGDTLWAKNIESQFTSRDGGYLAVMTRLRLANEGAARDNIQQMLAGISTLEICASTETVAPLAGECPSP